MEAIDRERPEANRPLYQQALDALLPGNKPRARRAAAL
jgi:hypothetical protein